MSRTKLISIVAAAVLVVGAVAFGVVKLGADGPAKPKAVAKAAKQSAQDPVEDVPPDTPPSEAPTVKPYAEKLSGHVESAHPVSPKDNSVKVLPRNYDGCDHNYGKIGQCVPWVFPSGIKTKKQKCTWLAGAGMAHPGVGGADRQGLDPDNNKVACDD